MLAGRYLIEGALGQGGSAVVYRARDQQSGRPVAVKVLRDELIGSTGAKRFLREIQLLAALGHPNIMPFLDSGESDGRLFVVLPLMEDGTLRTRLDREAQLQLSEAIRLTSALCDALEFAHAHGVVHRDVKPENVLFAGDTPCLADFGIARAVERARGETTTTTGVAIGTPAYMSPEQASGERNLDARSDVYSLGCVLYEMIAGMQAFRGPTKQSVIAQHLTQGPTPLRVYRPSVPPALERVVAKAMMIQTVDRYQTAGEFRKALASLSEEGALDAAGDRAAGASLAGSRTLRTLLAAGGAAVATVGLWLILSPGPPALDPNKIVVFPLVARGGTQIDSHTGDEIALLIGSALDHTEPLKWIDGWTWLDSAQRANPMRLTAEQSRNIAKNRGARFYLDGSLLKGADSVTVLARLMDVVGDSVIAQKKATGRAPSESVQLLGLRAAVQLLPYLVDPTRRLDLRPLLDRNPAAIASFLQAEREYRLSHFASALEYYRRSIESDSSMALAAAKGAQAANWAEKDEEAHQLITLALSRESVLPPKYAHLAHGLDDFLKGRADSAAGRFRQALKLDQNWGEAWTALGEVYFHLFPAGQGWDSVATDAFNRGTIADPEFAPPVFHLAELALGANQSDRADLLLRRFQQFRPDSSWAIQLQLTVECSRVGTPKMAWTRWATQFPVEVTKAATSLALVARRYDCAESGFRAALGNDSLSAQGRWMATFGLQSLLLAQGRVEDARDVVDSAVAGGLRQAMTLYIVDAEAGFGMDSSAETAMRLLVGKYEEMPGYRLWYHATWERHRRDVARLAAIQAAFRANAERSAAPEDRFFLDVSSANLALARGESENAIRLLRLLQPQGTPSDITWGLWQPLASERLSLARLLLARGDYLDAIRSADSFDHPQPVMNLIFLPASLAIRIEAAKKLGNRKLEQRYRERLAALERRDPLKSP